MNSTPAFSRAFRNFMIVPSLRDESPGECLESLHAGQRDAGSLGEISLLPSKKGPCRANLPGLVRLNVEYLRY